MNARELLRRIRDTLTGQTAHSARAEQQMLMLGRILSQASRSRRGIAALEDVEFKVFSQFGDDGIIQWLIANLELPSKTFIEFGVEDYRESNTRFLMMNDNWSGFIMDGSPVNVAKIKRAGYYWRHDLTAVCAFVDRSNVNALIASSGMPREIGILHIDLDGNDYWIWTAIDVVSPAVVVLEYNSVFGPDRAITVPYDPAFVRSRAHSSNLYFGASLRALHQASCEKGYAFIGCNSAGNNAYFVRRDKLNSLVTEVTLEKGFVASKYRESRDSKGNLTFLTGAQRYTAIEGLSVFNVDTHQVEPL